MNILIKNAVITDPSSKFNEKKLDVLIEKGMITSIKSSIKPEKNTKVIEGDNLFVSPGWFDMQARFCDPGYEYKEDLTSGISAAMRGGFTGVCLMPSTNPPLDNKSQIEYIRNKSSEYLVEVFPAGSISQGLDGKELAEMYDMKRSGAVVFSDDKNSIKDSGLFLRALQYAENIGSFLMIHCEDKSLSAKGQMNEGIVSTKLGLKGIPSLAEEIMTIRNLALMNYAGGKLHIANVSCKKALDSIKKAKANGLSLTTSVAAHQLLLDDSSLTGFDTHFKVTPPLRSEDEMEYLKRGILSDTIDVICSDHTPEDVENKQLEFDLAAFGMSTIETTYPAANTALGNKISQQQLIEKLSINPRKILGLSVPKINENEKANLTVFDPSEKWTFETKGMKSKSKNSPFDGFEFTGKVIAVVNKGMLNMY